MRVHGILRVIQSSLPVPERKRVKQTASSNNTISEKTWFLY